MPATTTLEILTKDGEEQLVVTKTVVETRVYTRNRNRSPDQIPLGVCWCTDFAFKGVTFETSMQVGLDALIQVGIIGRPIVTYCFGEHIEVTYEKEASAVAAVQAGGADHGAETETAYICTNHTPAVILALATPKHIWCCHPKIEAHVRMQNPNVPVTMVKPTTDHKGRNIPALPLVLHKHMLD